MTFVFILGSLALADIILGFVLIVSVVPNMVKFLALTKAELLHKVLTDKGGVYAGVLFNLAKEVKMPCLSLCFTHHSKDNERYFG